MQETRVLRKRGTVVGHQSLAVTNWEHHQSWSSYNYIKSCPGIQISITLWSFGIWSKLERWKNLVSECLMSWQIKKKKKLQNNSNTINKMWISAYLSIIPFNINELSATIKRKNEWIDTKPRPINTLSTRDSFQI